MSKDEEIRMRKKMKDFVENAPSCLICKNRPAYCGIWVPPDEKTQWILDAPEDKLRTTMYPLCHKHHKDKSDEKFDRIENAIMALHLMEDVPAIDINKI